MEQFACFVSGKLVPPPIPFAFHFQSNIFSVASQRELFKKQLFESDTDKVYRSPWRYYEIMKFIADQPTDNGDASDSPVSPANAGYLCLIDVNQSTIHPRFSNHNERWSKEGASCEQA